MTGSFPVHAVVIPTFSLTGEGAGTCVDTYALGRGGDCTPAPTVFDNYCHLFIHQTFRTGLQTPPSPTTPKGCLPRSSRSEPYKLDLPGIKNLEGLHIGMFPA